MIAAVYVSLLSRAMFRIGATTGYRRLAKPAPAKPRSGDGTPKPLKPLKPVAVSFGSAALRGLNE